MQDHTDLFLDGAWTPAGGSDDLPVTDSFTGAVSARYRSASAADVDTAVRGARRALPGWAALPVAERAEAVRRIAAALQGEADALARLIASEVGMPLKLAARIQVGAPLAAWTRYAELAEGMDWEHRIGHSLVQQVPVGVVACITPWNYPLHQTTGKVAPALLAGCTVVLKPSELAPGSAFALARAVAAAGLPPGVFQLVPGTGPAVGEPLVRHPGVDMVSFTGSTQAGRRIAALAGADIKRVALELGGKSAAVVLDRADLALAVKSTLASCLLNSGQTCSALTRLLVPRAQLDAVAALVRDMLPAYRMGDPADPATRLGPLVSAQQRERVQAQIQAALARGAQRLSGPPPALPATGFFVPPTVLGGVGPDDPIAREEVFGPVLVVLPHDGADDAVAQANGTDYGLAAAVWAATPQQALAVGRRLRAGQVDIQGAPFNPEAPFGGFGRSGLGRENGLHGLQEFLEPVALQLPPALA